MVSRSTEGLQEVNLIVQDTVIMYVQSGLFQLPAILKIWGHYLKRYIKREALKVMGQIRKHFPKIVVLM